MFAVQKRDKAVKQKCLPNVLPCHIHHDGAVDASRRYWNPQQMEGVEFQTSYFRGRKLQGRSVNVPNGYRGVVLEKTERLFEESKDSLDGEEEQPNEEGSVCQVMDEVGNFDQVVVWAHETLPSADEDPYSKGLHQWISLAQAIHSNEESPPGAASVTEG